MAIKTANKSTLDKIAQAHPKVREELGKIYQEILTILSGRADGRFPFVLRSFAEQAALYAQGRKTLAEVNALRKTAGLPALATQKENTVVTKAPAGLSIHNYGLACFDEKTRVITDKGFKFFSELDGTEKVLAFNKDTGTADFEKPQAYLIKPYAGDMIRLKTRSVNLLVTPDHKMVAKKAGQEAWQHMEASALTYHHEIPTASPSFNFSGPPCMPLLEYRKTRGDFPVKDTLTFWKFLGYYISEGSCRGASRGIMLEDTSRYMIKISQSKEAKPDSWERIHQVLIDMGITFRYYAHDFTMHCKTLHALLHPLGGSHNKRIPEWAFNADRAHLEALYEALIDGDGSRYEKRDVYHTVSKQLAEDFCRLACMLGKPVSMTKREPREKHMLPQGTYQKSDVNPQWQCVTRSKTTQLLKNGDHKNSRITKEYYEGLVYCVQVPSGSLFVERKGRVTIAGNCDICLVIDGKTASWDTHTDFDSDGIADWMEIVAVFKKFGWSWGGDWTSFVDLPHFEKTFGKKPSDLLVLKNAGKVDAQGYVII